MTFRALTRRSFVQLGAGALLGAGLLPPHAAAASPGRRRLLCIHLDGGLDGLSLLPPLGDAAYPALRPTTAVTEPIALDGAVGLHPALAPLLPAYRAGELLALTGAGFAGVAGSHARGRTALERALAVHAGALQRFALRPQGGSAPLSFARGLLWRGSRPFPPRRQSRHGAPLPRARALSPFREPDGSRSRATPSGAARRGSLRSRAQCDGIPTYWVAMAGAPSGYPASVFGERLARIAGAIRDGLAFDAVLVPLGGFDTHLAQRCRLQPLLGELAQGLSALWAELGQARRGLTVVVLSEQGRGVRENRTAGTDDGAGGAALLLGDTIAGGRVLSPWPALSGLLERSERTLPVAIDLSQVLGELLREPAGGGLGLMRREVEHA